MISFFKKKSLVNCDDLLERHTDHILSNKATKSEVNWKTSGILLLNKGQLKGSSKIYIHQTALQYKDGKHTAKNIFHSLRSHHI